MVEPLTPEAQVTLVEGLQTLWLKHMEALLLSGAATSTDLATLSRVLLQNGWTLDPKRLPKSLRDKLTTVTSFKKEEGDDDKE